MTKIVPRLPVSTVIEPRCASTTCLVIDRPRPVPRSPLVVKSLQRFLAVDSFLNSLSHPREYRFDA